MRRRGRIDGSHAGIRTFVRAHGVKWCDLSALGDGAPDAMVCWNERIALVEVKGRLGRLTEAQVKFHEDWPVQIVRTLKDAANVIQRLKATNAAGLVNRSKSGERPQ